MTHTETQPKSQTICVPQCEQSPFMKRLEELVNQRNGAEMARVFSHVLTQYPHLKDVYHSLDGANKKSHEKPIFITTVRTLMIQLSGRENFFSKRVNAGQIREHLVEIFSCPYEFERKAWSIRPNATEHFIVEEQNLISTDSKQQVVGIEELNSVRSLITDFLEMIGQLARRIHSCEMTHILRTLVAVKGKPGNRENLSPEAAAKIADDIVYCYEAVRSEINLLSPAERTELVYPQIPRHRPDITIDANPPDNLTAEEKTKFCRDLAYERFKKENFRLLPFVDFFCHEFDDVKKTEDIATAIADSYKKNKPTLDKGKDSFDYKTMGEVLSADFRLYFNQYFTVKDFDEEIQEYVEYDESDEVTEDTPQQESKDRTIARLRETMDAAIKLSSECGSIKALDDWTSAQVIFEKRDGDFHSYSPADDDAAAAELEAFLTAFRRGRQRLWVDWMRHCRKDIKEKATPTEPTGRAMDNLQNTARQIKRNSDNSLYYISSAEMGVGPTDARQKTLICSRMTEEGATLVRDKGLTAGAAAKKTIKKYAGQPSAYTDEESLTRAINRYCHENGITLPNAHS